MRSTHQRVRYPLFAAVILIGSTALGVEGKHFFIDETTDFGNGCAESDLGAITSGMATWLNSHGWSGSRYLNADAWPQDFWEACDAMTYGPGLDSTYGDNSLLSVYAGHGNTGYLFYGFAHDGQCKANLKGNMRLGSMSGSDAGYGMWLTSCTLKVESLPGYANYQWLRQQFGFHNSPQIPSGGPGGFFLMEETFATLRINSVAWRHQMETDINGDDTNSPVVVSYGTTAAEADNTRDSASFYTGAYVNDRDNGPTCKSPQPLFYYNWVRENNGSSSSCL